MFQLDEPTALALYSVNRATSSFLLRHLPRRFSFWGGEKRAMWRRMIEASLEAADLELAFTLYRRQVDLEEWRRDVERLADEIADPARLCDELRKRHPEGWGLKLGDGVIALLRKLGRDVMPYVREKLESIVGGWYGSSPEPLLELARQRGWWDLWSAVVRSANVPKYFNEETRRVLEEAGLDDTTRVERLRTLAGVSREWNWPGVGLARVHALQDDIATRLYRR
ncbi:MAG: gliding motility protein, partial [Acidimicrobiales bacterium]